MTRAWRTAALSLVGALSLVACSSGSDSLYKSQQRTRTDDQTTRSAPDRDDPAPRPDPPTSGSGGTSTPAPAPSSGGTDAGTSTPPPPAKEGSCVNPRCFGFGGTCGCQGGDTAVTFMGCENGQCACGDLVFDDSGGCGVVADVQTLKALFSGCLCN